MTTCPACYRSFLNSGAYPEGCAHLMGDGELPDEDHPTPLPSLRAPELDEGSFIHKEAGPPSAQEPITQELPAFREDEALFSQEEYVQRLSVSDRGLFEQLGGYIGVGKTFVFLGPELFSQPGFSWLASLLPEGPPRPYVLPSLGSSPVLLPGAALSPLDLPRLSLAQVSCDRLLYRRGLDEVHLFVLDLLSPGAEQTLLIQTAQTPEARHTVRLNAQGAGTLSLSDLPEGFYEVYLEGVHDEPLCRFSVTEPDLPQALFLEQRPPLSSSGVLFSSLGREVIGSLCALPGVSPVRGVFLEERELCPTPFSLERVATQKARLTAHTDAESVVVVVVDPTYPFPRQDALSPESAQKIYEEDRFFQLAQRFLKEGKTREALAVFTEARAELLSRSAKSAPPLYAYTIARCHARLGEKERSLAWLRTALLDGFDDLQKLSSEEDLSSLRDLAPYQTLLSGGRREVKAEKLAEGASLEIETQEPLALLLIGAYVHQRPWEGWAATLCPEPFMPRVEAMGPKHLSLRIDAKAPAEASAYLLVKDARLPSGGSPQERLAEQILSFLWQADQKLSARPSAAPGAYPGMLSTHPEVPLALSGASLDDQDTPTPTNSGFLLQEEDMEETMPGDALRVLPSALGVHYAGLVSCNGEEILLPKDTPEGEYLAEVFVVQGKSWAASSARFSVGKKEEELTPR